MVDLLDWLKRGEEHPLIGSCLFHYELEFIHPFSDGNGRMGRLWQTLILRQWKPLLGYLPVETVIRDRQNEYYRALAEADERADAAPFVEFMLQALRDAMREAGDTDQVSDQVTDQVEMLLETISNSDLSGSELMNALGFSHRPTFRANYLNPAMEGGWLDVPNPVLPGARRNATVYPKRPGSGCKPGMKGEDYKTASSPTNQITTISRRLITSPITQALSTPL